MDGMENDGTTDPVSGEVEPQTQEEADAEYGVENIRELMVFVIRAAMAYDKAMEDEKFHIVQDAPEFLPAFKALLPAVKDINLVPREARDMDLNELDLLHSELVDAFDLENDKVERAIEHVTGGVVGFVQWLSELREILRS